ncbi:glycosyl transferase group 2 family protein [Vibrio variabilis]|uniref:Glycosyl transferase group 2 family protein n=1 Tax=Vibrio variabilis TaxID=990271 RepID=A0ABQ0J618_9VIBR|nr:glycosyl transferase group 2 family protein [Vibrio variabilis]
MKLVKRLPRGLKENLKRLPYAEGAYKKLVEVFRNDYHHWIDQFEHKLWLPTLKQQHVQFSIVVPVYNPPVRLLRQCVESVLAQHYTNWQLIIVNDSSTSSEVNRYLNKLRTITCDERIVVTSTPNNQHISIATNVGLNASTGKYIALLDHDDLLAPQALNEIANEIIINPRLKWLYSDEDFINEKGKRIAPHFKSDWNPYLLHAHNYITHLCVYERKLLKELGGCRVGVEGAQDYDLALRASELLAPDQIKHIPKVLYHWRMHKESTASQASVKSYTVEAGKRALIEHLQRNDTSAVVEEGNLDNYYKVNYLVSEWPKVSVIIPTRDNKRLLEACTNSVLYKTDYPNLELVVMDNQTTEPSAVSYLNDLKKTIRFV